MEKLQETGKIHLGSDIGDVVHCWSQLQLH